MWGLPSARDLKKRRNAGGRGQGVVVLAELPAQGMIGTAEMEFFGEPSTSLSL